MRPRPSREPPGGTFGQACAGAGTSQVANLGAGSQLHLGSRRGLKNRTAGAAVWKQGPCGHQRGARPVHRNLLQGMWVQGKKKNQNKPLSSSVGRENKSCLLKRASGSFEIQCVFCCCIKSFVILPDDQGKELSDCFSPREGCNRGFTDFFQVIFCPRTAINCIHPYSSLYKM